MSEEKPQWLIEAEETTEKARAFIKVGKSYVKYPTLPPNSPNRQKIHIRGIIDQNHVVYRVWLRRKRYWYYQVEHFHMFGLMMENGSLVKSR